MPNYKIICVLKFWSIHTTRKGYKRVCVKKKKKKDGTQKHDLSLKVRC